MAEILAGFNMVPHSLLQYLGLGKAIFGFSIPDEDFLNFTANLVCEMDLE